MLKGGKYNSAYSAERAEAAMELYLKQVRLLYWLSFIPNGSFYMSKYVKILYVLGSVSFLIIIFNPIKENLMPFLAWKWRFALSSL